MSTTPDPGPGGGGTSSGGSDDPWWFEAAEGFFSNPTGYILGTVAGWIAAEFVTPLVETAVMIVGGFIDTILWIGLGPDDQLTTSGFTAETPVGVVEIPLYAVEVLIEAVEPPATALIVTVQEFNRGVQLTVATAGLAGLPVATALAVAELVIAGVGLLFVGQSVAGAVGLGGVAMGLRGVTGRILGVIR